MEDVFLEYNINKTKGVRPLGPVDITALKTKVLALSADEWDKEEDYAANYNKETSLQQTKHIIFRFANKRVPLTEYFAGSRWNGWKQILLPIMEEVVKVYGYKKNFFPKVMLANVPPGCLIPAHIDGGPRGFAPHKIHLALTTNDKAFFYIVPDRYHFEEGFAYEVNNGSHHSVVNQGTTDRIHLLFECLDLDNQPEVLKEKMIKSL